MSEIDPEDFVCGESFDHAERVTFEDEEVRQWMCDRCGAEGWEDLS